MRNNKIITASLNKKIIENEKKMQSLVTIKKTKLKSNSLYQLSNTKKPMKKPKNKYHRKNQSQEEIRTINSNKPKQLKLQYSTIQYDDLGNDSNFFINKNERQLKSYSKIERCDKNFKNKNITNNNIKNDNSITNSKKVNKKELAIIVNRLYTNANKRHKQNETEKNIYSNTIDFSGNKTQRLNTKSSKINFNELYSRFEDYIIRRKENIERKREELNNDNKIKYTYKPKLNINKKFFDEQNKDNFLERQKKYVEEKKIKEERYKEDLIRKEEEEINKTNILNKNNNRNRKDFDQVLNDLNVWDNNRKKKIEQKKQEKIDKIKNEFDYIPKIDKRSESLAKKNKNRKKESDVFTRLAKEDKILKEKYKILVQLYTPTFKPNISNTKRMNKIFENNMGKEFDVISKKFKSDEFEDNSETYSDNENLEDEIIDKDDSENNNYDNSNLFTEENIQNAYRKALFHKNKK